MIMNTNMQPNSTIHLGRRAYQRLNNKSGSELYCDAGVLWVTQPGDRQDYILLPGDKMVVTTRGKVLVEAMREADFHLI
jgi:hypothetical protein